MISRYLSYAIACAAVSMPVASYATGGIYPYSNLNLGDSIVVDESRRGVLTGDTGFDATFCDDKSEFYCVTSELLSFAVPKALAPTQKVWVYGDYRYEILRPVRAQKVFGENVDIMVIEQSSISDKTHRTGTFFYYSPKRGLLAFGGYIERKADGKNYPDLPIDAMISSEPIGFGAERAVQ